MRNQKFSRGGIVLALMAGLAGHLAAGSAAAQTAPNAPARASAADAAKDYQIPVQPLASALRKFAELAGRALVYDSKITAGKQSGGVSGTMSAEAALAQILAGSGLSFKFTGNGASVLITGAETDVHALGIVRVDGSTVDRGKATVANGVNGSNDMQATEGTGSYTTNATSIATKSVETLKDTPFAVSVITRKRLDDQQLNSLTSVMDQMTGVNTTVGATNQDHQIYSRGFLVKSFSVDGGAPLSLDSSYAYKPLLDLSVYDSVQLQRGAAGQYFGFGDPGGVINLVRKKPLDHNQLQLEGAVGSWQNYRASIDATGPLAWDGKVRGRVVMTEQDNHYFYQLAKDRLSTLYGNLEIDLTPTTRLSGGVTETIDNSLPFVHGLPRYSNGADIGFPTSTCLCFTWNRYRSQTTEVFAQLDQKISTDWALVAHVTRNRQSGDDKEGLFQTAVNPVTKKNGSPAVFYTNDSPKSIITSTDVAVSGAFDLLGQRQELTFGADLQNVDGAGSTSSGNLVFSDGKTNSIGFDPYSYPNNVEPPSFPSATNRIALGQRQWGAFASLKLTPFDGLHVLLATRYTRYRSNIDIVVLCQDAKNDGCTAVGQPDPFYTKLGLSPIRVDTAGHNLSKPNLSLIYDLTKNLSAFGTYASIYTPQANYVTKEGKPLAPVTGSNAEFGLKWSSPAKDLNASLSGYVIQQRGFAVPDPSTGSPKSTDGGVTQCCYLDPSDSSAPNKRVSKGVDAELTGQLRKNWQLSFGYTYNLNKTSYPGVPSQDGVPLVSTSPKNIAKLFTTYHFDQGGDWLQRLTVGGGVNWQSAAFAAGTYCATPNPTTGVCPSGQTLPFHYTIEQYALLQASVDYQLDKNWHVTLNGTNLTNHHDYQTNNGLPSGNNWYLQPAAYQVTLRGKW